MMTLKNIPTKIKYVLNRVKYGFNHTTYGDQLQSNNNLGNLV